MNLSEDLARRADAGNPVKIGLIGAGEMGTDIVTQVTLMRGLEIGVLAEIRIDHAWEALAIAGIGRDKAALCETLAEAEAAMAKGLIVVTAKGDIACTAKGVHVIIDATGNPGVGAELAIQAMDHGKHVVMMNVEADITIGAYLARHAAEKGVVYSLAAGDEPACTMELVNFARALGYPIVCAGKGKNNPLKFDATPEEYAEEAKRRNMNARMLVEFVDGSKTMIEMVAVANATGLIPDQPGMHGPKAGIKELDQVLIPKADGGLLSAPGRVDYSVGPGVAPGVFVIVKAPHPRVDERLRDLKVGKGPYYTLHRPYHLTSLETPLTAAKLALYQQADMTPLPVPVAEVATIAKFDLEAGVKLGKIGDAHYRGWAVTMDVSREKKLLPIGLAERAVTTKPIKAGEYLTYDNCAPDESMAIVKLRRLQDKLLGK